MLCIHLNNVCLFVCSDDLLSSAGSLVDALLVSDDALLNEWSSKDLVECVCHAIEQTLVVKLYIAHLYSGTSEQWTLWGRVFCPLF